MLFTLPTQMLTHNGLLVGRHFGRLHLSRFWRSIISS